MSFYDHKLWSHRDLSILALITFEIWEVLGGLTENIDSIWQEYKALVIEGKLVKRDNIVLLKYYSLNELEENFCTSIEGICSNYKTLLPLKEVMDLWDYMRSYLNYNCNNARLQCCYASNILHFGKSLYYHSWCKPLYYDSL